MTHSRHNTLWWWAGAVALPAILIAALLGVVTSADSALERIPVALVNNDELIEQVNDDGEEEIILASRPLVTELVSNDDLAVDWVITGSEQADLMLRNGEVYAVVEIPEDFSAAVVSLDDPEPQQASFSIRTDASHSYLASVLSDTLGSTIAMTISDEFGKTLTEGLLGAIVDLGDGFTEAADAAEEVADGGRELADGVGELKDGSAELADGTAELSSGYAEFDDGLTEYLDGLRTLADGAETLNRETSALPELSDGIGAYTGAVGQVATGLGALSDLGAFDDVPDAFQTDLQTLLATLDALSSQGATLASQTDTAIDGVRTGIVGIDSGTDALAENSYPLEEGSDEIRQGVVDLADGVVTFDDGVGELVEGTRELADGLDEFASGLRDGADEIDDQAIEDPSDATVDTLTSPVIYDEPTGPDAIGFHETLTAVFVPLALWFIALLATLRLPTLGTRVLTSTTATGVIFRRLIAPILGLVGIQAGVAVVLMHTLGGLALTDLGWSLFLITATALAYSGLHYALWVWRPSLVAPVSVTAGVVQVITLGALIPVETLPALYQTLGAISPMAWSADALIAAIADGGASRVLAGAIPLVGVAAVTLIATRFGLARARHRAMAQELGLTHAV